MVKSACGLIWLSALLLAGCGGDKEVLLNIAVDPPQCWNGSTPVRSMFLRTVEITGSGLRALPAHDECMPAAPPTTMTAKSIGDFLRARDYVARVDANITTQVALLVYAVANCPPTPPLMCLLGSPLPPGGDTDRALLRPFCETGGAEAQWTQCLGLVPKR
jgi:hypothetical protein